ncbi:MAG: peptidylprolyl isomerase [Phycisphaeraceae bacterium]|nr:peptidylprolyl isomerase [Phycisphaeraceae bacterium]
MSESDYPQVKLETSEGPITVELWDDVAPGHAENFLKLVDDNFYDGLTFHRILPGFVIQGGCPNGNGTGGPGWTVDAEFNDREHVKGVLSMARSSDPDSAGSQFFICLGREHCQHLDGQYTAFGKVVDGMDAVDKIAETELADARSGSPVDAPAIEKAERA